MALNARHSMPAGGYDGSSNGRTTTNGHSSSGHSSSSSTDTIRRAPTPLPHIEDVVVFPNDIDRRQSMRQLLDLAEATLAKSEMSRDYGKPAIALKDYLRASVIVVQIIPTHYDYKDLKSGRSDWQSRHNALLRRISRQAESYDQLKAMIVADNKLSGVKPSAAVGASKANNGWPASFTTPPADRRYSSPKQLLDPKDPKPTPAPMTNGSAARSNMKPAVHPKPPGLMANAGRSGHARAVSAAAVAAQSSPDLAARFSNLRGPQSLPGQDPRIKTHQIVPPKPLGPREMPPSARTNMKLTVDSAIPAIPALPKMPDAIYSPARTNGSTEGSSSRPPPSTSRATFSRTGSSMSVSSPSLQSLQSQSQPRGYSTNGGSRSSTSEEAIRIPQREVITPEELFEAMKSRALILIIDIRPREHFDDGHIMSSATICIEPSILIRDGVTADDIAESLVLSPSIEQMLFEKRSTYDLVVLYNKRSTRILPSPRSAGEAALASIRRALADLSYGHELRNPPKLLEGGIEAWGDLMGASSLQTSNTCLSRPALQASFTLHGIERRPSKYVGEPLKPDMVKVWQEAVETEEKEVETATEQPPFHRSTESFLRRFPSLSVQESMTSPTAMTTTTTTTTTTTKPHERAPSYGSSHKVDLYTDLPSPPTRPAPAVPRPSYSGLSQVMAEEDSRFEEASTSSASTVVQQRFYTGLNNPNNWCYANATLQSLLASPDFGRELSSSGWLSKYKAPKKEGEKIEQPQLMIKIMSNLFHWMTTGKFQVMKAQTLMEYSRHLCQHGGAPAIFGGPHQQDAQEFMSFLMDHLSDETNSRRNRPGTVAQPNTQRHALVRAAYNYWQNHLELNQSIVERYWRGLELSTVECLECRTRTYNFTPFDWIPAKVVLPDGSFTGAITLEQSMQTHIAGNPLDDFSCDRCRTRTRAVQHLTLARMPPLLCLGFTRFVYDASLGSVEKAITRVLWDINDVDFTPYFLPPDSPSSTSSSGPAITDRAFTGPFRYECYAVVMHSGNRTDNGHYFVYVRDWTAHDPHAWWCCNDNDVHKVRIGSGDREDLHDTIFKYSSDCVPYLAFFRRKS